MSWSTECTIPPGEFEASGHHRISAMQPTGDDRAPRERDQQFELAKSLVEQVIESGAVGDPSEEGFRVSISGHANRGHCKPPGWAADSLTIQISQLAPVGATVCR